jgi:CheY-like chemotaxis protein
MRERGLLVPMVMLTGHLVGYELKDLRARGLSGWLFKPPSPEQLARVITRALKKESK